MAVGSQTSRIACTNETCNNRSVCWFSAQSSCQTAAALLSIFDELVQSHPPHRQLFIVYSDIKIKHNTWFWRKYSTELYLHIHVSEPVHCYNMYYYALHQGSPHIHAYLTIPACSAVPPIFSPKNPTVTYHFSDHEVYSGNRLIHTKCQLQYLHLPQITSGKCHRVIIHRTLNKYEDQ